jgi:hypothetical protein
MGRRFPGNQAEAAARAGFIRLTGVSPVFPLDTPFMAATGATALRTIEINAATAKYQQILARQFDSLGGWHAIENIDPGFLFTPGAPVFSRGHFTHFRNAAVNTKNSPKIRRRPPPLYGRHGWQA